MQKNSNFSKEMDEFMNSPEYLSDEYLQKAYDARTNKDTIKYLKESLKLNPNNLDSERYLIELTEKDNFKRLNMYKKLASKEEKKLKKEGFFDDDCVGIFWGIIDTRPYMRIKMDVMKMYSYLGMYSKAIDEGFDMLRLCENDNMGVRYPLASLCVLVERFDLANKIFKKYPEETTLMLFPKLVMYYKQENFKKLNEKLPVLDKSNKHIKEIINGNEEKIKCNYYSMGDITEASIVFEDNSLLLTSTPGFIDYLGNNM